MALRATGWLGVAFSIGLVGSLASAAGAETRLYRFALGTPSTISQYVAPLPSSPQPSGPYFSVDTDAKGRITSVAYLRSGRTVSRTDYQYGDGDRPTKASSYENGEATGYETFTYYGGGDSLRSESYTTYGKLTGYTVCSALASLEKDCDAFNSEGKLVRHRQIFYNSAGVSIRMKYWDEGADAYHVAAYGPLDGLEVENAVNDFAGDQPRNTSRLTYDAVGNRVRRDGYDGKTKQWFASIEYQDDLPIKKSYKYFDGSTYVSVHHYNDKQWWESSDIYVNGALLFRFNYVRQPNGAIVKSQAIGPNGDLWAEYPDKAIDEVDRTGHYTGAPGLGSVYKQGNWW